MYTLDQFIDRLKELREIAGGNAPVIIESDNCGGLLSVPHEEACVEVQYVGQPKHDGSDLIWNSHSDLSDDNIQAIKVF